MNMDALRDAWRMFRREHQRSVDRMVCDPELRSHFLADAMPLTGARDEEELLWGLVRLRKSKSLSSATREA